MNENLHEETETFLLKSSRPQHTSLLHECANYFSHT